MRGRRRDAYSRAKYPSVSTEHQDEHGTEQSDEVPVCPGRQDDGPL